MATPALQPVTEAELAAYPGYNYGFVIDATLGHITMATANTEQVFTAFTTKTKYDQIRKVGIIVTETFQNTADAAYNTTTIRVGKTGTDNAYVTATQMNTNGTVVYAAYSTGSGLPETFTAAVAILITLGAQAAKSLSNLNAGRVIVLF